MVTDAFETHELTLSYEGQQVNGATTKRYIMEPEFNLKGLDCS